MKGFFFVVVFACYTSLAIAQCGVQVTTTPVICNGQCNGTATAYPFGGIPPYSYQWGTGDTTQTASGFCAGTYLVSITDSVGCQATAFFTIQSPPPLVIFYSVSPASCSNCCDGSITPNVAGGTGSVTYSWTGPNGYTSTQANITGLCVGTYTLCVTDANGCTRCQPSTVNFTTGLTTISETTGILTVYPDPANEFCNISAGFSEAQQGTIRITNCVGELMQETAFESTTKLVTQIDLSMFVTGFYVISVVTETACLRKLLIIQ